jgi:Tfp pilus assembly protein PilE
MRNYKASTIVELLVVMIIMGIIFTILFDGMNMIKKFSNKITAEFAVTTDMLLKYKFIDNLFVNADSVKFTDTTYLFFKKSITNRVNLDTCFKTITKTTHIFIDEERGLIDSLYINILLKTDTIFLRFGVTNNPDLIFNLNVVNKQK